MKLYYEVKKQRQVYINISTPPLQTILYMRMCNAESLKKVGKRFQFKKRRQCFAPLEVVNLLYAGGAFRIQILCFVHERFQVWGQSMSPICHAPGLLVHSRVECFTPATFENWHIAADQIYFSKNWKFAQHVRRSFPFQAKLKSNIIKWNFGIAVLQQFGPTWHVPNLFLSEKSLHPSTHYTAVHDSLWVMAPNCLNSDMEHFVGSTIRNNGIASQLNELCARPGVHTTYIFTVWIKN